MDCPSGKSGLPKNTVAQEVAIERKLAKMKSNGRRVSRAVGTLCSSLGAPSADIAATDEEGGPATTRGRPGVIVTEGVVEQRRLSKQRRNACRVKTRVSSPKPTEGHTHENMTPVKETREAPCEPQASLLGPTKNRGRDGGADTTRKRRNIDRKKET